ncbi:alpha-galactosidase [Jidongwangia harbinensis]|uniref:alpha-galactosidase n=1 Tax=Jidongwangia harbinensis TaxID=2878561 RepID=UPI001CD9BC4B|nr:alpha-galactosidase [Jidongwangia harbinensis]MCA2214264.1 alpha-galactosidase [Jidongwangia harbinensis]
MPHDAVGAVIASTAAGVTVLIDARAGRLPAITYWGAALPPLDAAQAEALLLAGEGVAGTNTVEPRPRIAVLPEHHTGWIGRPGLRGSFAGTGWSPAFAATSVTVDGAPVAGFVATGPATVTVAATDDTGRLELSVTLELLPAGLLRARAAVRSRAAGPYDLADLVLAFPVPAEATELLDFTGRHNRERVPQRGPFRSGLHLRENRKGRTGADSAYLLHAGTAGFGFAAGEVWAVHTAWSGNHTHYAEQVFTGEKLIGGGELLLPGEVRLGAGETYRSPWVYAGYGTGLDEVARRFHRHLRSRERPVGPDRPVTLNVWEAVYFDHDTDRLRDLAERAAAVGVERYVLDDGWFGSRRDDRSGLGDWVVSPDAWPHGLHPLIDRVRALGMQFGLWVEPEMVNPDSDLARAHPEWIMAARGDRPIESRHQQVLDLGVPGAYRHVRSHLTAILDEYPIDYLKWDHNRDLVEAGTQADGGRPGVHAQTLAVYRLLDEIRAAYPGLEIESCSSGGGRVDLGVLARTDRVWVSDNIDPHDRQAMLRWTTQLVPPEYLGSHIASGRSHTTGRRHDLGFRAATAVFGHLGVEWDLARATDAELAELRAWIRFFTEQRDLLLGGDLVRMDGTGDDLLVHGVVAPDRSRALFAMVTTGSLFPDPAGRLRFRGLHPDRRYRVRPVLVAGGPSGLVPPAWWGPDADGDVFSGAALALVGVAPPRLHPDQAVLFRVQPAEEFPPPGVRGEPNDPVRA